MTGTSKIPPRILFAGVWLVNGLYGKVLDEVPRHREIVARIPGEEHSMLFHPSTIRRLFDCQAGPCF